MPPTPTGRTSRCRRIGKSRASRTLTYQDRATNQANQSTDIGLYRRLVDIPASFAGQRVLWHFDGAFDGAEVFVNGQRCGYHESGFTAFNIDVTKALKPGQRNLMAVRVYKKAPPAVWTKASFWCLGGIYRETYLVALPPLHVDDVTVVTDLDGSTRTPCSSRRSASPARPGHVSSSAANCVRSTAPRLNCPP